MDGVALLFHVKEDLQVFEIINQPTNSSEIKLAIMHNVVQKGLPQKNGTRDVWKHNLSSSLGSPEKAQENYYFPFRI